MQVPDSRRRTCAQCLRPERTCICRWVVPMQTGVDVLILQHPLEADHAKGSARLLHMCLPNSRLVIGETFEPERLQALLHGPASESADAQGTPYQAVLLYPPDPETRQSDTLQPASSCEALPQELSRVRLVVLDATWRKSRKMLHLNPLLQTLPRLSLRAVPASQYRIRKAHAVDQLSTFEAACHALVQLECNEGRYRPLFEAFEGFVNQQSAYAAGGRAAFR